MASHFAGLLHVQIEAIKSVGCGGVVAHKGADLFAHLIPMELLCLETVEEREKTDRLTKAAVCFDCRAAVIRLNVKNSRVPTQPS